MGQQNMHKQLTLGSLFSGSGGFELGGVLAGIRPVWNCEVEPFPILVTTKRFPEVKHYGDISTLNGAELPPVDIITGGFPCQSVSIAGRREGVQHIEHGGEKTTRSGLFYEAVRIIKEMREATHGEKPRFFVVENVPGLFSSNKGEDFRRVLEEIIGIVEPEATVPAPDKKGWPYADCYLGDGWSVAYRVLDAQYWGVPQRRARIFLVADFGGGRAPEILFESEGVSGYTPQGFRTWQGAAGDTETGAGAAGGADEAGRGGVVLNDQGGANMDVSEDVTGTLRAETHGHPPVVLDEVAAAGFCTEHSAKARSVGYEEERSPTLRAGVVPAALALFENHSQDTRYTGPLDTAPTVNATYGMGGNNQPFVVEDMKPQTLKIRSGCEGGGKGAQVTSDLSSTLGCNNDQTVFVPYGVCSKASHAMLSDNPHSGFYEAKTSRTLDLNGGRPDCSQGGIAIVAFTQNQRDEVRDLGDKSGALAAEPGMKQQTYVAETREDITAFHVNQRDEVIDLHDKSGALMATQNAQMQTYVLQGSMIGRADKNGPQGDGINEEVSFTLDTADRHAVAYCMTTGEFTQVTEEKTPTLMARDYKDPPVVAKEKALPPEPYYIVRRLTPTECARLQGFPTIVNIENKDLTRDEVALIALAAGFIEVDADTGEVYGIRGPGGVKRRTPIKLKGSIVNGYRVYSIHAGGVKKQIRANRLVWMSVYGRIPEGFVVDHINNDKQDNRICNLQLLTAGENSHKAYEDGLYLCGDDSPSSRITESERRLLSFLYWNTDKPFSCYAEMFGISKSRAQQIIHEYEWCKDLAIEDPTDEDIAFWTDVFETHRKVVTGASRPKTEKQIRKWLKNPHSDSAEYKLWGNGLCAPIAYFVLSGIVWAVGLPDG